MADLPSFELVLSAEERTSVKTSLAKAIVAFQDELLRDVHQHGGSLCQVCPSTLCLGGLDDAQTVFSAVDASATCFVVHATFSGHCRPLYMYASRSQVWLPDLTEDGSIHLKTKDLPFCVAGTGDLLALFRCISSRYSFATDVRSPSKLGAPGRVFLSSEVQANGCTEATTLKKTRKNTTHFVINTYTLTHNVSKCTHNSVSHTA